MSAVDIMEPIREICDRLGVDPNYVSRMDISPTTADVTLYRGQDGRCKGSKFLFDRAEEPPTPALEQLHFEVTT